MCPDENSFKPPYLSSHLCSDYTIPSRCSYAGLGICSQKEHRAGRNDLCRRIRFEPDCLDWLREQVTKLHEIISKDKKE